MPPPADARAGVTGVRDVPIRADRNVDLARVSPFRILGPRARGMADHGPRAKALLETVGLSGFAKRFPCQLSGEMRQRASIARALINHPEVLLMDEPSGAPDAQTRLAMQEQLPLTRPRIRPTILFVTHDIDGSIFPGERVPVMSRRPGRILQEFRIGEDQPRGHGFLTSPAFTRVRHGVLALLHGRP